MHAAGLLCGWTGWRHAPSCSSGAGMESSECLPALVAAARSSPTASMAQASPPATPAPASFLGTGRSCGNAYVCLYVGMVNVCAYVLTAIRSQKWRRTIHMAMVTGCFTCTHAPAYVMCVCACVYPRPAPAQIQKKKSEKDRWHRATASVGPGP